jgi:hemoglobin-like flavoprotein
VDAKTLDLFDRSLLRCETRWDFLDRFYERFLAASPEVREKFATTDFVKQKRALRASLHHLLLAAQNEARGPDAYLGDIAARHGAGALAIGAHLYDFWLDALLATVKECDPEFSPEVEKAWEDVMMVGIRFLCANYHRRGGA